MTQQNISVLQNAREHTPQQVAMVAAARQVLERGGKYGSNALLAKAIGTSKTTAGNLRSDDRSGWPVPDSEIWDKLRRLLKTDARLGSSSNDLRAALPLQVTRDICTQLSWAHENGDVALVYGIAGGGKTFAATQYARDNTRVFVVTMSPQINTSYKMLRRLHLAVAGKHDGRGSDVLEDNIVCELRRDRALLIVDEAHFLPQECLDTLRCVHDQSNDGDNAVGLALLGNGPIVENLSARRAAAQILGRIGAVVHIDSVAALDAHEVGLAAGGGGDAFLALCKAEANRPGGIRRLVKNLRSAMRAARGGGGAVDTEALKDAIALRGSIDDHMAGKGVTR